MNSNSVSQEWLKGFQDTIPLTIAAIPFAIIYGALGQSLGLDIWIVFAMSLLVYAGASQFIALSMLTSGASIPLIIMTVFMVNLRHSLYSVSLLPFVSRISLLKRLMMGFTLTDETFAVVINHATKVGQQADISAFYLGSASVLYSNWVLFSVLGFYVGSAFPQLTEYGLDVAMVVAFSGIVAGQLRLPSYWLCALVAGVSGALTYHWPHQSGLVVSALLAITIGVWSENQLQKKQEQQYV
ncbi:AzlC family ABC transporter permease [Paraneptunicella aestuarii]|uniref:AzlC family ABC transporter permease n=1 Tax=Paraneptunicella aestuarii TaxID=2831148 RepID=UPI001E34E25C|nr:AzlC family ABC transporter permease [Paraneptunicella aestuarii]UAA37382.1 AzlC family ABC transporter permease [Paraneptunicella aestuarii]